LPAAYGTWNSAVSFETSSPLAVPTRLPLRYSSTLGCHVYALTVSSVPCATPGHVHETSSFGHPHDETRSVLPSGILRRTRG